MSVRSAVVVPEPRAPIRARLPSPALPAQGNLPLRRRVVDQTDGTALRGDVTGSSGGQRFEPRAERRLHVAQ